MTTRTMKGTCGAPMTTRTVKGTCAHCNGAVDIEVPAGPGLTFAAGITWCNRCRQLAPASFGSVTFEGLPIVTMGRPRPLRFAPLLGRA